MDEYDYMLSITLPLGRVPVSYLSSLLRVVQASLREVAWNGEATYGSVREKSNAQLQVSRLEGEGELTLRFVFVDFDRQMTLKELSSRVFEQFLDGLVRFVQSLPQPSLWGGASRRLRLSDFDSEVDKRMGQLYRELRRSSVVRLAFRGRKLEIEGDRMEFSRPD